MLNPRILTLLCFGSRGVKVFNTKIKKPEFRRDCDFFWSLPKTLITSWIIQAEGKKGWKQPTGWWYRKLSPYSRQHASFSRKSHRARAALTFLVTVWASNHKDARGGETVRSREGSWALASGKDGVGLGVDFALSGWEFIRSWQRRLSVGGLGYVSLEKGNGTWDFWRRKSVLGGMRLLWEGGKLRWEICPLSDEVLFLAVQLAGSSLNSDLLFQSSCSLLWARTLCISRKKRVLPLGVWVAYL